MDGRALRSHACDTLPRLLPVSGNRLPNRAFLVARGVGVIFGRRVATRRCDVADAQPPPSPNFFRRWRLVSGRSQKVRHLVLRSRNRPETTAPRPDLFFLFFPPTADRSSPLTISLTLSLANSLAAPLARRVRAGTTPSACSALRAASAASRAPRRPSQIAPAEYSPRAGPSAERAALGHFERGSSSPRGGGGGGGPRRPVPPSSALSGAAPPRAAAGGYAEW